MLKKQLNLSESMGVDGDDEGDQLSLGNYRWCLYTVDQLAKRLDWLDSTTRLL